VKKRLQEDPSGYTTAFTHPDPLDPNDAQRQRTQARSSDYPYDMPMSYGSPTGVDDGGASYQTGAWEEPPKPRHKQSSDEMPKDLSAGSVWEKLDRALNTVEIGPQGSNASELGYGSHGRMGEDEIIDIDMDDLNHSFRNSFQKPKPKKNNSKNGLFAILIGLDPHHEEELLDDDGEDELSTRYPEWSDCVYAPGAEEDPTNED
jgi:hypothetical protein